MEPAIGPCHTVWRDCAIVSSRYVLGFALSSKFVTNAETQSFLHRLAQPCSDQVFGGKPVDIWIHDPKDGTHVTLSWESRPR